jgi:transcriptional regulator with XRE-family HTH domain
LESQSAQPAREAEPIEALAERAGIAARTLSRIEAGHANPTRATARDTAALGVSISELAKLSEKHE